MPAQGNNLRLRDRGGTGQDQHPGPEKQDSQHMLKQPRGISLSLQLCTFVHFWAPFCGEFSSQNGDMCGQSWTIVDKYAKPPFTKPPFRLSLRCGRKSKCATTMGGSGARQEDKLLVADAAVSFDAARVP